MPIVSQGNLADGRALRILRFVSPTDDVPEDIVRYVIGSLGFDSYNRYIQAQAYWRSWYRKSFDGLLEGVASHLYVAEVEGEFAARLWFAYSRENGLGNFGNVYTEPRFRRLGLMNELLGPCMTDFDAAQDARILCCASGNRFAVASYLKHGFRLPFGGETGRLERTRRPGEDFFSIGRELQSMEYEIVDGRLRGTLALVNKGFSAPVNPRSVFLKVGSTDHLLTADVRRWFSCEEQSIAFDVPAPDAPCTIGLWMPDEAECLRNDERYAIRCANAVPFRDGVNILSNRIDFPMGC